MATLIRRVGIIILKQVNIILYNVGGNYFGFILIITLALIFLAIKKMVDVKKNLSLFQKDYFKNAIFQDYDSNFETYFTDEQVINIMYKISNRNTRKLVWEFERIRFKESGRYLHLKFILHQLCMKLFKI